MQENLPKKGKPRSSFEVRLWKESNVQLSDVREAVQTWVHSIESHEAHSQHTNPEVEAETAHTEARR